MNWNNYLLDEKSPGGTYAHLGVFTGSVRGFYDLSEIPESTVVLEMSTPLKKFKLKYTNLDSLIKNDKIEAISLTDIDEERIDIFAQMANLKYLHISNNQQEEIPDLSPLKSIEVLVLSGLKRVQNIEFLKRMKNLKTLYIYGINHLHDLTPISYLTNLQELSIHHGKMSGTGKSVQSLESLQNLKELKYLELCISFEDKKVDLSPLYKLKKLQKIFVLPKYLKKGNWELLKEQLPLIK